MGPISHLYIRLVICTPDYSSVHGISHLYIRLVICTPDYSSEPPISHLNPRLVICTPDYSSEPPISHLYIKGFRDDFIFSKIFPAKNLRPLSGKNFFCLKSTQKVYFSHSRGLICTKKMVLTHVSFEQKIKIAQNPLNRRIFAPMSHLYPRLVICTPDESSVPPISHLNPRLVICTPD